jgi:GMP synthase (glutamine-hydrolysing)
MSGRFLLLQAREPSDAMAAHEQAAFAAALNVDRTDIVCHDLLAGVPGDATLEAHPLLLVGGSGRYSTLDDESWLRAFFDFLSDVVVPRKIPTFASCFGFQALVLAGGGDMVRDPSRAEVGTFDIELTEHGLQDPLLAPFAPRLAVQLGHKDHATRLPAGIHNLARSELSPFQATRVDGTSIFATQFHPELDREGNLYRFLAYRAAYAGSAADDDDGVAAGMRETPEATSLLPRWLEEVTAAGASWT